MASLHGNDKDGAGGRAGGAGRRAGGPSADRGDIVIGWLVKIVAVAALVGVLGFDGVSLGIAKLAVADTAATAAREANGALVDGATTQQAYNAAYEVTIEGASTDRLPADKFMVGPGRTVTLTVERTSPTLVLHYIPRSESWLVADATASHGSL